VKVGILGGGQLGRMLALAGYPLGFRFRFLDPAADAPAGHLAELVVAPYDDRRGSSASPRGSTSRPTSSRTSPPPRRPT